MRRTILLIAGFTLGIMGSTYAQSTLSLQYSINFPTSSTSDYISQTSFRGVTFDYDYRVLPNISVGVSLAWYTFYEALDYDTYSTPGNELSISGKQYRYLNSSPLLFTIDYHLMPGEMLSPFAGIGVGVTYNRRDTDIGIFEVEDKSWQFSLAPEIGVEVPVEDHVDGYISLRYNNSFESADLERQSYLSLNIGVIFGSSE